MQSSSPRRKSRSPKRWRTLMRKSISPCSKSALKKKSVSPSRRSPPRRRSSSSRRSPVRRRSPLNNINISPRRCASSSRRFSSTHHGAGSPGLPSRRLSPYRRSGSPAEKGRYRYLSGDHASGSIHHSSRVWYSAKPGPMGRYNSRLDGGWDGREFIRPATWTCKKCSEVFQDQQSYINHVEERNWRGVCPTTTKDVVQMNSAGSTSTRSSAQIMERPDMPRAVISLQDSPPCISLDLSDTVSDSDLDQPIVPPLILSAGLHPISDQFLPTSPVSTSAPTSLLALLDVKFISAVEGCSPPRVTQEMVQSMVSRREDRVLVIMQKDLPVEVKKRFAFRKDLFKASVPNLVDIPDCTRVKKEDESRFNPHQDENISVAPVKRDRDASETLQSAENLNMTPIIPSSSPERSAVKRQLPDDDVTESNIVKKVRRPKPDDDLVLLLDKKKRKRFIKTKSNKLSTINQVFSTAVPEQREEKSLKHRREKQFVSALLPWDSVRFKKNKIVKRKTHTGQKSKKVSSLKAIIAAPIPILPVTGEAQQLNLFPIPTSCSPVSSVTNSLEVTSSPADTETSSSSIDMSKLSVRTLSSNPSNPRPVSLVSPVTIPLPVSMSLSSPLRLFPSTSVLAPSVSRLSFKSSVPPPVSSPPSSFIITSATVTSSSLPTSVPTVSEAVTSLTVSSSGCTSPITSEGLANTCVRPSPVLSTVSPALVSTSAASLSTSPSNFLPVGPVSQPTMSQTPHHTLTMFSSMSSPTHHGEVKSLYQALGGNPDSEDEEATQPTVIRSGVDCIEKCPDCQARLEIGARSVNFSLNMADLSILMDCMECGVRVKLKGVLGSRQMALLSCGM